MGSNASTEQRVGGGVLIAGGVTICFLPFLGPFAPMIGSAVMSAGAAVAHGGEPRVEFGATYRDDGLGVKPYIGDQNVALAIREASVPKPLYTPPPVVPFVLTPAPCASTMRPTAADVRFAKVMAAADAAIATARAMDARSAKIIADANTAMATADAAIATARATLAGRPAPAARLAPATQATPHAATPHAATLSPLDGATREFFKINILPQAMVHPDARDSYSLVRQMYRIETQLMYVSGKDRNMYAMAMEHHERANGDLPKSLLGLVTYTAKFVQLVSKYDTNVRSPYYVEHMSTQITKARGHIVKYFRGVIDTLDKLAETNRTMRSVANTWNIRSPCRTEVLARMKRIEENHALDRTQECLTDLHELARLFNSR